MKGEFMNTYNLNDADFEYTNVYKEFMNINKGLGHLSVRAYGASEAIPIQGLMLYVSTIFNDDKIIVFEGYTDESGIIENISLPAPLYDENNLVSPVKIVYNLEALYKPFNFNKEYSINVFDGITVEQNIIVNDKFMGDM